MTDLGKSGVIDVGGGMRGIYAAGVLDRCLEEGISFDVALGISAGSANVASFLAQQKERNIQFYTDYSFRKEYMGVRNFLDKHTYIDLDYVYSTLSNEDGENPLDFDALRNTKTDWRIIACDAETGETRYFSKEDIARNEYDILKASSAIPFICHPYEVEGHPYYDGALGDTIPLEKAFAMGCTKVVLVLTKPKDLVRTPGADPRFAALIQHRFPQAAKRLRGRADRYNYGVELAKVLEEDGLVLILAPDDTCGVDTLTKDEEALFDLYSKGYEDGKKIKPFLEA